ncbi:MAG: gliding motility-associated protein GldE [Muribaculaceae bacterium]|nr:gliding motility-associated protein GldE [Muribaculaceae bacterium]
MILALADAVGPAISFHAPPSWGSWSVLIAIVILCLFVSAFVSGSEIAFFGLTPQEIEELEESDTSADRRVVRLLSNSERLLATILISNNLVNISMVVILTFAIGQTVVFHSPVLDFLLQTVLMTFLLLICGEIFPKLVARGRTLWWVRMAVPGIAFLNAIFSPLSRLMVRSSFIVKRVVSKKEENISPTELGTALEISDVKDEKEKEMLEGILSFGEKEAREIMISRVDVTDIELHDSWEEVMKVILDSGYSRIPVYDTSQDSIAGILYSKDLLPYVGKVDADFKWQKLIREAYFVPESRMIDDLLEDFRKRKIHIAIVIDEYGGTQGIVTLEDIIEQIVGDIDDEYDEVASMYKKISPDSYYFDGKIMLPDFCDVVGISEEELGDTGDAETLAGLVLNIKGDFPVQKEVIEAYGLKFMILKMEKHRIVKVKVTILPKEEVDAAGAGKE